MKTIIGFLQLILCLALALFGPAWTVDFWQAWLYLFIFIAASALITYYLWRNDRGLLERRIKAGPAAETNKKQQIIQAFASCAFIAILLVPSLDHRFAWSHVPLALIIAGDLLVAIGFYCVYRVFKVNTFTAATIEVAATQRVVTTGPMLSSDILCIREPW
jgi:protein-S-isoprenylcysteine O-methyltransferase Ste14